jgi:DNA mismatch endonuclease, patch repair protein
VNARDLPGSPDVVLRRCRVALFVHGCFWHQHQCPRGARRPATNRDYWDAKLDRNVTRDRTRLRELRRGGWRCIVVWECQTRDGAKLRRRLARFLRVNATVE